MERNDSIFPALFENAPDAIFIQDIHGYVLDCNPAAAILHRTTIKNLVGAHVSALVPTEQHALLINYFPAPPVEFESVCLADDGVRIPVSIRTSRIDYGSQPALLLHVRDLTARKLAERNAGEVDRRKLETQIRGAQRMEAIGRLAGGVAHDFNNLLTVVIGRSEILLDRIGANHPMRPDVLLIHDAAHKAAQVTRQLLAFGRKQVLQPKILDLNEVLGGMNSMLRSLIRENIRFTLDLDPATLRMEADRGQIEQVILNLVVNSIDAMPNGGALDIRTGNMDLLATESSLGFPAQPGHYAVFSVRDTGTGMDPETLSHVFEPFFTTKEESKGTGLGLSTAYGIVKQSGGYITASSELGQGTVFRVYLPGRKQTADPVEARPQRGPGGAETILVVEDAEMVRTLTRELLEARGYAVMEAASGEEALQTCRDHAGAIDLILTDITMPNMNGRELAERAVRLRPGLKVLLMSGYTDEITRGQIIREGFQFIAKPFTSNSLAAKVRESLDG